MLAQERPVPSDRTGAGNSTYDSDRVTACADQKGDATGSPDCVPQTRPTAGSDRSGLGSPVQGARLGEMREGMSSMTIHPVQLGIVSRAGKWAAVTKMST